MKQFYFSLFCLVFVGSIALACGSDEEPTPTSVPPTAIAAAPTFTPQPTLPPTASFTPTTAPGSSPSVSQTQKLEAIEAYPAPIVQGSDTVTDVASNALEAYPAPVSQESPSQTKVVTTTSENTYPAPCPSETFSFAEPVHVADKIVKGKGPAGIGIRLVNVTTLGDILGPDVTIDDNNEFSIPLSVTLRANHSIGLQVIMPDGGNESEFTAALVPCANVNSLMVVNENVGFVWARTVVNP